MILALLLVCVTLPVAQPYNAAVVEFTPSSLEEAPATRARATELMLKNLGKMSTLAGKASSSGVDIIVFPEYCLIGATPLTSRDSVLPFLEEVPSPYSSKITLNPCLQREAFANSSVLIQASCMARAHSIAVVFDMGSISYCTSSMSNCPPDGRNQYNTQVAMDSDGALVGRYRKFHLYYEPWFNSPAEPDVSIFSTRFGESFGMVICFDMLFGIPSQNYSNAGIRNVVLSTWWQNMAPLQLSIEIQQTWSYVYNGTILAAGMGLEGFQSSGSGIYSFGAVKAYYFNPDPSPSTHMLTWSVDYDTELIGSPSAVRHPRGRTSSLKLSTFSPLLHLSSLPIDIHQFHTSEGSSDQFQLKVSDDVVCSFSYTISNTTGPPLRYVALAMDVRSVPTLVPAPVVVCAICECDVFPLCGLEGEKILTNPGSVFQSASVEVQSFNASFGVWPIAVSPSGVLVPETFSHVLQLTNDGRTTAVFQLSDSVPALNFGLFQVPAM